VGDTARESGLWVLGLYSLLDISGGAERSCYNSQVWTRVARSFLVC